MSYDYQHISQFEFYSNKAGRSASLKMAFWLVMTLAVIVAIWTYFVGMVWLGGGLICLALLVSMFISPRISFYVFFAWQAFDGIFIAEAGTIFTPSKALALFMIFLYFVSFGRIKNRIIASKRIIQLLMVYSLFGLAVSAIALAPLASLRYSSQILVLLILLIASLHFIESKEHIKALFFWCFAGTVVASLVMIITGGVSGQYTRGTIAEYVNPNTTALALSTGLISVPGLMLFEKKIWWRLLYMLGAVVLLIGVFKTGSRSAVISTFFGISIGAAFGKSSGVIKRVLIPVIVFVVVIGSWLYVLRSEMLDVRSQERLTKLFTRGLQDNVGSRGRFDIWTSAVGVYARHRPLIGFGLGNTAYAMAEYGHDFVDIHSTFLSLLVDTGLIGFLVFVCAMFVMFIRIWRITNAGVNVVAMMIFAFLMISSLTHTIHFTKWFWMPVMYCLLLIEYDARQVLSLFEMQADSEPFSEYVQTKGDLTV